MRTDDDLYRTVYHYTRKIHFLQSIEIKCTDMDGLQIHKEACELINKCLDNFEKEIIEVCGLSNLDFEWLDTSQISELFSLQVSTVNYYRRIGVLPYTRFGSKCYYKATDVADVLQKYSVKGK